MNVMSFTIWYSPPFMPLWNTLLDAVAKAKALRTVQEETIRLSPLCSVEKTRMSALCSVYEDKAEHIV